MEVTTSYAADWPYVTLLPCIISILPGSFRSEKSKHSYCMRFEAKLIPSLIDVIGFKSTQSSPKRTTPCMRDNVTMEDEFNQGTPAWTTHMNKNFRVENIQFATVNSIILSLCSFTLLSEVCILNLHNIIWQLTVYSGLNVCHIMDVKHLFPINDSR